MVTPPVTLWPVEVAVLVAPLTAPVTPDVVALAAPATLVLVVVPGAP